MNKIKTEYINNTSMKNLDNPFNRIPKDNDSLPQYIAALTHTLLMYHPSIKHQISISIDGDDIKISVEMH